MAAVASKNLYELLGNDPEEDSDREPEAPVNVVDKTPARTDKRSQPREAPSAPSGVEGGRGGRRGGFTGNEAAIRDRNAGSSNNRGKPVDDQDRHSNRVAGDRAQGTYEGRGRGGRGGRGRGPPRDDRHSKGTAADSEKQAAHGWGANEGPAELADEQAGEAIAQTDEKEAVVEGDETAPDNAEPAAEPEPEDNSISYSEYLAKQAEKKLALGTLEIRKPNEGTKENKQWANAKPVTKDEEETFIAGSGGKAKRERERKQKQILEIDQRFVEAPESRGGRGGRGRGDGVRRGSRGDGPFRGSRGDGPFRGSRGDRGDRGDGSRGGRGRGDGAYRGSRGGPRGGSSAAPINTEDTNAFPSLGS